MVEGGCGQEDNTLNVGYICQRQAAEAVNEPCVLIELLLLYEYVLLAHVDLIIKRATTSSSSVRYMDK